MILAQATPDPAALASELGAVLDDAPTDAEEALDVVGDKLVELWTNLLQSLPVLLIGLVVLAVAVAVALAVARGVEHSLGRNRRADPTAVTLVSRIVRLVLIVIAGLFALAVMGISITSVVAGLAVLGLAVGLAVQGILENLVAGLILLMRKPFRAGDQIRTGDFEGTVEDIDLRVTRLATYDGTTVLVPNRDVYSSALINLTRRGSRRTTVMVGVDYRDDHDAAREVIRDAVEALDVVRGSPPVEVYLAELGESSVDFAVRFWTDPRMATVWEATDQVLAAVKTALQDAGMTIPWPIRTLVVDGPVRVDRPR